MKLILIIVAIVISPGARACSCKDLGTKETLRQYAAVFSGQVMDVRYVDALTRESPRVIVTFHVLQSWKGEVGPEIVMHTRRRGVDNCEGLLAEDLGVGKKMLIFGYYHSPKDWNFQKVLATGVCSRTQPLAEAAEDILVLGPARKR